MTNFNAPVIPQGDYSPITAKGGRRRTKNRRTHRSKRHKRRTRRYN